MRLLIDTHAFLWFCNGNREISHLARQTIESSENEPVISIVCLWEIAIKTSLGKLDLGESFENFIVNQVENNGFTKMNINERHLKAVIDLPFFHRDPFDRLLISQAIAENLPIISFDTTFDAYPIKRIW